MRRRRKFLLGTLKVGLDNISRTNIGFERRKIDTKEVFRTLFLEKEYFFTINSDANKKSRAQGRRRSKDFLVYITTNVLTNNKPETKNQESNNFVAKDQVSRSSCHNTSYKNTSW